jgi:hypothetical protein
MCLVNLSTAILLAWMKACCLNYGVEPEFALAVARVESGTKTEMLRFGPMGKSGRYYGPFGIERSFLKKWPIDNPFVNIEVGVKALRGPDKRRVLRRYNATFNEAYFRAVMMACRKYKSEGLP